MRAVLFLVLFYYSVYSQSNSDSLKKASAPKQLKGLLQALRNTECIGPKNNFYAVFYNENGLVFKKILADDPSKNKIEKIIIPPKNELNFKVNSHPQIACDVSESQFKGRIYICWSDLKNGINNEDVFLVYSDDEGENWSEPILITYYPNHKSQLKPVLFVSKVNGQVYLLYYDKKNSLKNNYSDITLASSKNGGLLFEYFKLNSKPFLAIQQYPLMELKTSKDKRGELNVSWFEKNNEISLTISDSLLNSISQKNNLDELKFEKTFLFKDTIVVPIYVEQDVMISAAITKPLEPGFERIVLKDKRIAKGERVLTIKTNDFSMKKGSFILTLYYHQKNKYCWITKE